MIVITGATGTLGKLIVERLLQTLPPAELALSVRDPSKASAFADRGIRVRQADFTDPATLPQAFAGATQVLLISSNSGGPAASAVAQHTNAIQAAKSAGAQRILYTSHMGSSPTSAFAPMRDHAGTELALQHSGVPFTSLRNGFYAASALMMMGKFLDSGKVIAPPDGPVSWATHADLADAAVIALTDPARLSGITPALTGPESLDLADLARIASQLTGRPITRVTITDEENHAAMLSRGAPAPMADLFAGLFRASRALEFAALDPTLASLLPHPPTSMHQFLTAAIPTPH